MRQSWHICSNPNCGYKGRMSHKPKGNRAVMYAPLLISFGVLMAGMLGENLPVVDIGGSLMVVAFSWAVIYCIVKHGSKTICPRCHLEMRT